MISHKYKCIYLHIPRTGGTSIEALLEPEMQRRNIVCDVNEKHYTWHQAKEKYAEYWKDYFKFTFVRNPLDRVVSCLIYSEYFGITNIYGLEFKRYKEKFGFPVTLEFDERTDMPKPDMMGMLPGSVYGNFIGDEMDFIGKYEDFDYDMNIIKGALGIKGEIQHLVPSIRKTYKEYYKSVSTIKEVVGLYFNDMLKFGYI